MSTVKQKQGAFLSSVNGPVCHARNIEGFHLRDMVLAGEKKLIGEVIALDQDDATLQIYEDSEGLRLGDPVENSGQPLQLCLAPGLLGHIFDGIERPLEAIRARNGAFIPEGLGLLKLDEKKVWPLTFTVKAGDKLNPGECWGTVAETAAVNLKLLMPPGKSGTVKALLREQATINEDVIAFEDESGREFKLTMSQYWPIRRPRPVEARLSVKEPLVTGQRVIDSFFPLARGGSAAIPGGFGTGKTMTQHQIAKWSNADIIIYIGCGERGNEMTDALEEFQKLEDPRSGRKLIDRTILIANTSNMPVAAREASIYTGITMAEYYRDQGYDVAIMADSASRWAEALREISGRLEEMPAEEGYPAYLASRLAEFYERVGRVKTLGGDVASITAIGAVSPAGGDFSEPVTENTRRLVGAFYALDRKLAYARHFPAIYWMNSYSSYAHDLRTWYSQNVNPRFPELRDKLLDILQAEDSLKEIVQLVGEAALPADQRLTLEVAALIKTGFLQQNAFNDIDRFASLPRQFALMRVIVAYEEGAREALRQHIPYSEVRMKELQARIVRLKYELSEEHMDLADRLIEDIQSSFEKLSESYASLLGARDDKEKR